MRIFRRSDFFAAERLKLLVAGLVETQRELAARQIQIMKV